MARQWRRLWACRSGSALATFAMAVPVFVGLGLGAIEITMLMFDYHRASEATRRGARTAAMVPVMADLSGLAVGQAVECHGTDLGLECAGVNGVAPDGFNTMLTAMQAIHPGIQRENVTIAYRNSGVGDMDQPGGMKPVITVGLQNMTHAMLVPGAVPGLPAELPLPDLSASQMGVGYRAP